MVNHLKKRWIILDYSNLRITMINPEINIESNTPLAESRYSNFKKMKNKARFGIRQRLISLGKTPICWDIFTKSKKL